MDIETRKIPLSEDQVREIIRRAYRLSRPQGMGYLHFKEGEIPENVIDEIASRATAFGIAMDYVMGRSVKLGIDREGDQFYYSDNGYWFDHSAEDLRQLLDGIAP